MKKYLPVIPLLTVVGALVYFTFLLKIKEIECVSNSNGCEYVAQDEIRSQLPLEVYNTKRLVKKSLLSNNYIENYSLRTKLPNKLIIDVSKRKPAFALGSSSSDTWYSVVAENGLVLSIEENTDLNILYSEDLKNPGEFVEPEVLKGYMVYKYIQPYFKVEQAEIHQDALFLQTNKGHQALLPFDKDEKLLIGSIMVVFNRLNSSLEKSIMDNRDSQKISELCINGCLIDFRFQNPIIKAKI